MPRFVFDFECIKKHRHEHMVESDVRVMGCPTCGKPSYRLIAAPRISLDPISGDYPTATQKWEQHRESHMKKERKNKDRHGTYK